MPTDAHSTNARFTRMLDTARQLVQLFPACASDAERELLVLRALTAAHMDGMDAATEIANDAIARVVLRGVTTH